MKINSKKMAPVHGRNHLFLTLFWNNRKRSLTAYLVIFIESNEFILLRRTAY